MTVDVARGLTKDYSAFCVMDTTTIPYRMVAKYRNNKIKPLLFPNIINDVAKAYNHAFVMIEVNDIGGQVADTMQFDLEYDNLLMCSMRGRAGQVVGQGFSGSKVQLGVKMSTAVKKTGCANMKQLIEDDKLIFNDYDIIAELTTFIQKGQAWEAEEGCNDDLAMCLVIFSWLATSDYFRELHDSDVRARMYAEQKEAIELIWHPLVLYLMDSMKRHLSILKVRYGITQRVWVNMETCRICGTTDNGIRSGVWVRAFTICPKEMQNLWRD